MEYKIIPNFEKYGLFENGDIINIKTNKILKKSKDNLGYIKYSIYGDYGSKTFRLHRLLGEMYLPKIEGKNIIDHKDGNKENNNLDNLRWCNQSENARNKRGKNKYQGVHFDKSINKWLGRIKLNGKTVTICRCDTQEEASQKRYEFLKDKKLLDFFKY